jgi:hypothetical protein
LERRELLALLRVDLVEKAWAGAMSGIDPRAT